MLLINKMHVYVTSSLTPT